MSWFRPLRLGAVVLLIGWLAACGYRPLYGERTSGEVAADLSEVRIELIEDRSGQILHNMLRDRINPSGRPADPGYRLTVSLNEGLEELGIRKDETATRVNFRARARYALIEMGALDEVALRDEAIAVTSYNIVESDYATLSARDDARERALQLIADRITLELSLYFNSLRERDQ